MKNKQSDNSNTDVDNSKTSQPKSGGTDQAVNTPGAAISDQELYKSNSVSQ